MNLQDVFSGLAASELQHTGLVENYSIKPITANVLITLINQGLDALYTALTLKIKEKLITYIEDQREYSCNVDDDFINLIGLIYKGNPIPTGTFSYLTNNFKDAFESGIYGMTRGTLSNLIIGEGINDDFTVCYKALHPKLATLPNSQLASFDPSTVELELPRACLNALTYYVAHAAMTGKDAQAVAFKQPFHAGNNYLALYEKEIVNLKLLGVEVSMPYENSCFDFYGFV